MSQRRSQILTSNSGTRSKRSQKQIQMAYFQEVITEAGVTLGSTDIPNVINQEQSLVIRDIERILKRHISYPNNAEEFMTGVETLCRKEVDLRRALSSTQMRKTTDAEQSTFQNKIEQKSLFKLLLSVKCTQNQIITLLLNRVTNKATEEDNDTVWIRLLLNPLCYLSNINDPKKLTKQLLDILEVATYPVQVELLNLIPEIIPDSEYEETAKQLSKLLDENNELKGAIIDCLNSLNLNSDIRAKVQEHILSRLLSRSSLKIFPILFQFLTTDSSPENLLHVLRSARDALDAIMSLNSDDLEAKSNKVIAANCATASKKLCESWITVVSSIRSHTDHKSIDIFMLIMIHSSGHCRKSTIEAIFKKRIKSGHFKTPILENLFQKYFVPQLLKDHFNSIIDISSSLLKFQKDYLLVEFSSMMYKMLFAHEYVDRMQRQDILHNLIFLTCASDHKNVTSILNILESLKENFSTLQKHSVQLMGLLEKLDTFELKNVQQLFNLLCSLTCGEKANESLSGLKDELHMLIRKQLSSSKRLVKHRGIIAAIMMVKYIITTTNDQSNVSVTSNLSITSIADLPRGPPQEAAGLLELANTSSANCPESVGLYYDQLAEMILTAENLEKHFMEWLFDTMTNDFQNMFVTSVVSDPINDVQFSMQYSLNCALEEDSPIAVNIGEFTMKPEYINSNSIVTLAPLFHLLRMLHHHQYNGDLSSIDALLGCSVIMPDLENIENYDSDQLKQVTNCIFHCINWFRELVSAFVLQTNKILRRRVLQRLKDLVELEYRLKNCLKNVPDHRLPVSYFDVASQKTISLSRSEKVSRPKKRAKTSASVANIDETIASTSAPTQQIKARTSKKKGTGGSVEIEIDNNFREMDTNLIRLLRYPLDICEDIQPLQSQASQPLSTINLKQFSFILKDFTRKLEILTKRKNMGLSILNTINSSQIITDSVRLLPHLKKHLNTIIHSIKKLLEQSDGIHDSLEMFTPEGKELKLAFGLIFECFSLLFGWSGFQNPKYVKLLRDCLKCLQDEHHSQLTSANKLALEFMNKMLSYSDQCFYLPAAVSLVETMQALYLFNMNPEMKKKIATISGKLLSRKWYNLSGNKETGRIAHANVDILVKAYLSGADVKTISGLVGTLQAQATEIQSKQGSLPMLQSIDKANFPILYRCLCNTLLEAVRSEVISLTNKEHLILWRTTALTMQGLMAIVKVHESKPNLSSFLKKSLGILKVFLSQGIPILEIMLRSQPDDVMEILKTMQTSTRFLHHLCCYSKLTKDAGLVAYVPQFRLTLESLLYRVKAALVANNCSAAFWIGILRNKDLQGEDILSQSTVVSDENAGGGSENEELPSEDSDEEMFEETASNGSASDIF